MEQEPAETFTGLMIKHFDALLRHSAQCFFQELKRKDEIRAIDHNQSMVLRYVLHGNEVGLCRSSGMGLSYFRAFFRPSNKMEFFCPIISPAVDLPM